MLAVVALALATLLALLTLLAARRARATPIRERLATCSVHIVVARYAEPLDWLADLPPPPRGAGDVDVKLFVYNKNAHEQPPSCLRLALPPFVDARNCSVVDLPNVGRCDHTYMHHIVAHYHALPDVCIFLPGSARLPNKWHRAVATVAAATRRCGSVFSASHVSSLRDAMKDFQLDRWESSFPDNRSRDAHLIKADTRPFGRWYAKQFGTEHDAHHIVYFGVFAVQRSDILKRSKEFYESLLKQLSVGDNVEVGHYVERSWMAMFSPVPSDSLLR